MRAKIEKETRLTRAASTPALQRPRSTLRGRMLRWVLLLAAAPALCCGLLFNFTVQKHLEAQHVSDSKMLGQFVAGTLSGRVAQWTRASHQLVESLGQDKRVAFACIVDPGQKLQHASVFDGQAWSAFMQRYGGATSDVLGRMPEQDATAMGDVVVHLRPIYNPPAAFDAHGRATPMPGAKLEGFMVLGVHDRVLRFTLYRFHVVQALAIAAIWLVSLPLIAWLLRRWTRPWHDLVEATRWLAEGRTPEPIAVRSQDEVGYLAAAFNDMAAKLLHRENELREANADLERKVQQRTVELHEKNRELERAATTDALTGLANRRAFTEAIEDHFRIARMHRTDLSVLIMDMDGFKQVNDTLGHDKGDDLLRIAAESMRQACRESDVVSRLGGDEFVVVLPHTARDEAVMVADRVRQTFMSSVHLLLEEASGIKVGMSQGLATLRETVVDNPEKLVQLADAALYRAKQAGKGRLMVAELPRKDAVSAA